MSADHPRVRVGVVDFVNIQLPFVLEVARRLHGIVEFHFFQPRPDTHRLLAEHRERLRTLQNTPPADVAWSDDELLDACGAHERAWAPSIPALLAEARDLAARTYTFLLEQRIDCVLIWNGAPLARAIAVHVARKLGKRLLYCENGYLPGTMQMDRHGVNFCSGHTAAIAAGSYRGCVYDAAALDETLAWLRQGRGPPDAMPLQDPVAPTGQRIRREFGRLFTRKAWRWLGAPRVGRFHDRLPDDVGRYALLPLQVVRDSQLSVHSPLLGADLGRFVAETYFALRRARPGCRLVVKLHPKESRHASREHKRIAARFPDIIFVQGQPIHELLAACELVVTINSTVGVEAMAFGKPVVALGRNFYTTPDLVHVVERLEALDDALRSTVERPRDPQAIRDFLGYLHQHMQVRGSYLDLSPRSIEALAASLLLLCRSAASEMR